MKSLTNRIARLMRIEQIRAVEKQVSLAEVALAERKLHDIHLLGSRIDQLAKAYDLRTDATDGYMLGQQLCFSGAMRRASQDTTTNAKAAADEANQKMRILEVNEKRQSAVSDARARAERDLQKII